MMFIMYSRRENRKCRIFIVQCQSNSPARRLLSPFFPIDLWVHNSILSSTGLGGKKKGRLKVNAAFPPP